jgi:hypothetical protein
MFLGKENIILAGFFRSKQAHGSAAKKISLARCHLDHALSGQKTQANLRTVAPTSHTFVALVDSFVNVLPKLLCKFPVPPFCYCRTTEMELK